MNQEAISKNTTETADDCSIIYPPAAAREYEAQQPDSLFEVIAGATKPGAFSNPLIRLAL
ncbi:MAG: hypothetical protein LBL94_09000 [Prevotellaceae bacterium]|jgi:hypothetical protein|nr:hypothetical protein [Prevotellaceae bacterium]